MLECSCCYSTAEYLLEGSPSVGESFFCWAGSNVLALSVHNLDLSLSLDFSSDL